MKKMLIGMGVVFCAFMIMAVVSLTGCAPAAGGIIGESGEITISINDIVAKSIMPDGSLDAGEYLIVGTGTSGEATGSTFDVSIVPPAVSTSLSLKPGGWTIVTTVMNDDVPSVAVGGATTLITVVAAQPQNVSITCLPYSGNGNLVIDLDWFPDVVVSPSALAEMKPYGGTSVPIALPLTSQTSADGTASLPSGWYTGALRIYDNSILSAGIVRSVRIAEAMTTTWTEYLIVSALDGSVTIDISYDPGPPLILNPDVPEGDLVVYTDQSVTITIPEPDHDAGQGVVYGWYMNGVLTEISTVNAFTAAGNDYNTNTSYYLSAVVFQTDGARAGNAQWKITKVELGSGQLDAEGTVTIPALGGHYYVVALAADGVTVLATSPDYSVMVVDTSFDYLIADVPIGTWFLKAFQDTNVNGIHDIGETRFAYYGNVSTTRPPDFPANAPFPHDIGFTFDFTVQ